MGCITINVRNLLQAELSTAMYRGEGGQESGKSNKLLLSFPYAPFLFPGNQGPRGGTESRYVMGSCVMWEACSLSSFSSDPCEARVGSGLPVRQETGSVLICSLLPTLRQEGSGTLRNL